MRSRISLPECFVASVVLLGCGLSPLSRAYAQDAQAQDAEAQDDATTHLNLRVAGEPKPPMKYRLLPQFRDLIDGNAAVWYGKVYAEQQAIYTDAELWQNYEDYMSMPLEQLRKNQKVQRMVKSNLMFGFLHKAARARTCDWQLRIREESYYSLLLPDVQQSRSFARLIALRARYLISQQDLEGAIETLQSGFALAGNVARGETVINALVGAAIHRRMTDCLIEFVQQPKAPNLYWAITSLPNPAIDFRPALEAELDALSLSFPLFTHVESDDFSASYWNNQLRDLWAAAQENNRNNPLEPIELVVLRAYPLAKQRLIAGGFDQHDVDAMPVSQVVLLQSYIEFQHRRQSQYRWTYLPYADAIEKLADEKQTEGSDGALLPLERIFFMRTGGILKGQAITQLYVELLRTIEAIRMHAALHAGELPKTLAEITVVPVPNDPMTGQPFPYQLDGEVALITPTAMDWEPNRFEITIAKKEDAQ